ncbi:hypothetical protein VTN00DRAFT_447 [Thermoascus crustaceus]|uniref:uncharacterized protein n=1 Tax=Thermoascus crustaceus TaxID=5088 RepID=UPI003742BB05
MADIEKTHHMHGKECFARVFGDAKLSLDDDEEKDMEIEITAATALAGSDEEVWMKFLNCLAELLSPVKGGDSVTATAVREREDYVEVDVVRNRDFGPRNTENNPTPLNLQSKPLFEDALGWGLVRRTKQEGLDFITLENLEKFRDELSDGEDSDVTHADAAPE